MKKTIAILLVLALALTALTAQGAQEEKKDEIKVALIVADTVDDKGWCQAMYDGLVEAKAQLGDRMEFDYSEKMKPVDAGSIARQYVADGYDLIIAHGAQYKNMITELAAEYPDVSFSFGTSAEIAGENVFTYMPESEETGYLSGLIAGKITKSGIVGLVGPVDGGDAARYNRGFVLGVKAVNPAAKILVAHTGSFSDFVKAGELAATQIKSGADVLTGSSQQAIGALRACAEYDGVLWLGQDLAQLTTAEGQARCVAASSYNYAAVIVGLVENLEKGVKGGVCIPMNFSNGGFVFDYNETLKATLSADVLSEVDKALADFKASADGLANWADVSYDSL